MDQVTVRKGGIKPDIFPHVCPYAALGADQAMCTDFTTNFNRNMAACVASKCNSRLRKCFKCVEEGLGKKAEAVKDANVGLCVRHASGKKAEPQAAPRGARSGAPAFSKPAQTPAQQPRSATAIAKKTLPTRADASKSTRTKVLDGEVIPPRKDVVPSEKPRWQHVLDSINRAMADAVYVKVDPAFIRPLKGQPRDYFDEGDLSELADSVADIGQIQPGIIRRVVRDGVIEYELLDGERRWRAVRRSHVAFYKAMLVDVQDDYIASFLIAAIANFNRADHTQMEISNAIEKLRTGLDMPIEVIAKKFNISVHWAYQLHGLQKLHPRIQGLLDPKLPTLKRLPIQVGIQISKIDQSLQENLVERFRRGEVTVKTLRAEAVKASKAAGTYVRQREADQPARIAKKMKVLAEQLRRNALDYKAFLEEDGMADVITSHPNVCSGIRATLQVAEDTILAARYKLGASSKK